MKFSTILFTVIFSTLVIPAFVFASEITIRPFLIDVELSARDTYEEVITLSNDYQTRKAVLYATVNEISVDAGGEIKEFTSSVMTDRTNTVTSWIEISRGRVEIPAGESAEVPLTVRVHPNAEPGEYHAFIGMVEAANRTIAEAIALSGDAEGVILKVVVSDEREDGMKIAGFLIDRFITSEKSRTIDIQLENTGDFTSIPSGEVIFYDARGVEVESVPVNQERVAIAPGEAVVIQSAVPLQGGFGKYKANVSLEYGDNQKASLYDTTYFYLMPMHVLAIAFFGVLIVSLLITHLLRRSLVTQDYDDDGDEVMMYVKDGHVPNPQEHDIDLKNKSQ